MSTVCRLLSVNWENLLWAFKGRDVQDFEIGSKCATVGADDASVRMRFKRSDLRRIVAYYVHSIVLSFGFFYARWIICLCCVRRWLLHLLYTTTTYTTTLLLGQLELDLFNQHLVWQCNDKGDFAELIRGSLGLLEEHLCCFALITYFVSLAIKWPIKQKRIIVPPACAARLASFRALIFARPLRAFITRIKSACVPMQPCSSSGCCSCFGIVVGKLKRLLGAFVHLITLVVMIERFLNWKKRRKKTSNG